jgi:hypothetical protein
MKAFIAALTVILIAFALTGCLTEHDMFATQPEIDYASLKKGFSDVPHHAKMRVWWFWHEGQATKKSITQDLEAMKVNGIGGAILCDNGERHTTPGAVFMSDEWQELFAHVIRESTRLGIEISLNIQSGCGDPGNPNIANDNGLKKILFSEAVVSGPKKIEMKLPLPPTNKIFYQDIAVQAVKKKLSDATKDKLIKNWSLKSYNKHDSNRSGLSDLKTFYDAYSDDGMAAAIGPDEVVDLTNSFKDGVLTWDIPQGNWTIIRYGMTSTGKRNNYASAGFRGGLCYDPINKTGIIAQWKDVAKPLINVAKENGDSLKFVHVDSWEMGLCNWTQDFQAKFKKLRGYDMDPYLPVLAGHIVGSRDISNRFLEDFRLTVGDLAAEENYQTLRDLAHAEGISMHSESAGPHMPPVDGLRTLGINDIPMGEAWARANTHRATEPKRMQVALGASAAHIYGKRFLAVESPTSIGPVWERNPAEVKNVLDRIFCTGVNRINWHTYDSSPDEFGLPGIAYFAGTHLNRKVTWWKQSKTFIDYINRSQHMLSQGLHVADVLGYLGSRAPLFAVLHRLERDDIPVGYAWDMCNADAFLKRASVKNGRVVLPDGKSYAVFALSDDKQMHLPVLRKIEKMVAGGMILVGNPPQRPFGLTGYPESDKEFKSIVKKLWPSVDGVKTYVNKYGKGKVYVGFPVDKVLEAEKIGPDLAWQPADGVDLEYIHHTSDDVDVYYVINKWARHGIDDLKYRYIPTLPDRFVQVNCSFRVDGDRKIERWDPVTGKITPVNVYEMTDGHYTLPVSLEPEGGAFFVFSKAPQTEHITSISKDGAVLAEGNAPLENGASSVFVRDSKFEVFDKGRYNLTLATGKTIKVNNPADADALKIQGPWKVEFMEKPLLGKPFTETFDTLILWTESDNRSVKYFSGTASYENSFDITKADLKGRAYLDLGMVGDIATVRVNGKEVGTYWKAPYIADVTDFIKDRINTLEVEVTNLWINRLVGDEKLPAGERKTYTNVISNKRYKIQGPDVDQYLRVSGLLGPVEIRFSKIYDLQK